VRALDLPVFLEGGVADLTTRVVNILKSPQTEWPVIAAEPTDVGSLFKGYVMPLAAIGPVASFLGGALIGTPFIGRTPSLLGVFIAMMVVEWLGPKFKSTGSRVDALKLVAYASTPVWIAGVLNLLPLLGMLVILAAIYSIYLFYLGLPPVMKTPSDQVVPYMIVAALVIIVINIVLAMILAAIMGTMLLGAMVVS
jgi:Na+/proline symporter